MVGLQQTVGDFVPAGSTRPSLSEETLHRGIAIPVLGERHGLPAAHPALDLAEFLHACATRGET